MKKMYYYFALLLFAISACSNSSDSNTEANLKTDIFGTWTVTRTLVSGSSDFPNGYHDIQTWKITKNGENAYIEVWDIANTYIGKMDGSWTSTQSFNYPHWNFTATFPHPLTGQMTTVYIDAIGLNPFKGANDTYLQDPYLGWVLADAFTFEGVRR